MLVDLIQLIRHCLGFWGYVLSSVFKKPYLGGYCFAKQEFLRGRFKIIENQLVNYLENPDLKNKTINVLEIGSYAGDSCIRVSKILEKLNFQYNISCCDLWSSYEKDKKNIGGFAPSISLKFHSSGKIFQMFVENILYQGIFSNVIIYRGDSNKTLLDLVEKNKKFDFIFIDGSHSYKTVFNDIKFSKKLVKDKGIIIGDDYELDFNSLDKKTIHKLINNNTDFTFDQKNKIAYHPGVTKAVFDNFGNLNNKNGLFCIECLNSSYKSLF